MLSSLRLLCIFFSLILKVAVKVFCVPLVASYLTAEPEPEPAAATPGPVPCSVPAFGSGQQFLALLGSSLPLVRFARLSI